MMLWLTLVGDQGADSVVAEIHALRMELRDSAVTAQRVQILIYRLQAQGVVVEKVSARLDTARGQCQQEEEQQKMMAFQMEQIKKEGPQNGMDQKNAERMVSQIQSSVDALTSQIQQCQGERAEVESQLHMEQGKMSELEGQLEQLDRVLAGK